MELVLFVCFAVITVASAALVVWHPHPVKSALFLIITFFAMGGLYLLLEAEFIALMQVLVYAGAVMVLFLFVIMLLNLKPSPSGRAEFRLRLKWSLPLVAILFGAIASVIGHPLARLGRGTGEDAAWVAAQGGNVPAVGTLLFQQYLLPFEATAVLLLVAVVGVIVLAKREIK